MASERRAHPGSKHASAVNVGCWVEASCVWTRWRVKGFITKIKGYIEIAQSIPEQLLIIVDVYDVLSNTHFMEEELIPKAFLCYRQPNPRRKIFGVSMVMKSTWDFDDTRYDKFEPLTYKLGSLLTT
jgi:hypothetical protein